MEHNQDQYRQMASKTETSLYTCKPLRSEVQYQYQGAAQAVHPAFQVEEIDKNTREPLILGPEFLKKPSGPALVYQANGETYAMPVVQMRLIIDCNAATVFGKLQLTFVNNSSKKVNAVLLVPTDATISNVRCVLGKRSQTRYLESTYIASDEAGKVVAQKKTKQEADEIPFTPGIFRLPLQKVNKKEQVQVNIDFIQCLPYNEGRFIFNFPTAFDPALLPLNVDQRHFMDIQINIANKLAPGIVYGSNSHELFMIQAGGPGTEFTLQCVPIVGSNHRTFNFSYYVKTEEVSAMMLVDKGGNDWDKRSSFTLTINPPILSQGRFPRDIVFLMDRSGSMGGRPYENAIKGLEFALCSLGSSDRFNVICFDHEQVQCYLELQPSEPNLIEQALAFCRKNSPRGLTNIKAPLQRAFYMLNGPNRNENSMKFVILLTDGCVDKEREICRDAQDGRGDIRVLTFGIGRYCNQLFLNMLSSMCHGWSSGSVYVGEIEEKMRQFLMQSSTPILNDIWLDFNECKAELYPGTIPDLYLGKPVQISGKFDEAVPPQVTLRGQLWNGDQFEKVLMTDRSDYPVGRIAVMQRIDNLQSKHWLTEDPAIQKEIIETSKGEQVPSMHTSMVSYELTQREKKKKDKKKSRGVELMALAGGVMIVGTAAYFAGDIAASVGNASPGLLQLGGNNLFELIGNVPDCPCDGVMSLLSCGMADCGQLCSCVSCGSLENCDCVMGMIEPFQVCCGPCAAVFEPIDGFLEAFGSAMGQACFGLAACELDACYECCGNTFLEMQDCMIGICGPIGSSLSGCLQSFNCEDCLGSVSNCMGDIQQFLTSCMGSCGDCLGNCGDFFGTLSEVADEIVS